MLTSEAQRALGWLLQVREDDFPADLQQRLERQRHRRLAATQVYVDGHRIGVELDSTSVWVIDWLLEQPEGMVRELRLGLQLLLAMRKGQTVNLELGRPGGPEITRCWN